VEDLEGTIFVNAANINGASKFDYKIGWPAIVVSLALLPRERAD
jgi:hypothetical protein